MVQEGDVPWACKICRIVLDDTSLQDNHMLSIHNKVRTLTCNKCGMKIKGPVKFDWHISKVHGAPTWYMHQTRKQAKIDFDRVMKEFEE